MLANGNRVVYVPNVLSFDKIVQNAVLMLGIKSLLGSELGDILGLVVHIQGFTSHILHFLPPVLKFTFYTQFVTSKKG